MSLDGEYGFKDVALGVPVRLGGGKVKEVIEVALDAAERKALEASAAAIRDMIVEGEGLLKKL